MDNMQIQQTHKYALGIDIGSTTAKLFLLEGGRPVFSCYARHFSQVRQKTLELLEGLRERLTGQRLVISISGSAGLGLARAANLPFVQEVFATCETVRRLISDAASVVELGGEDARRAYRAEDEKIEDENELIYDGNARHCGGGDLTDHNVVQQGDKICNGILNDDGHRYSHYPAIKRPVANISI